MSVPETGKLIKRRGIPSKVLQDILISALILLSMGLSFALGRLSHIYAEKPVVTVEKRAFGAGFVENSTGETATAQTGAYVGSKNGDKYHLPWCSGAKRINEENKVWFESKEDAEAKGYSPAVNCKGI